MDDQAGIELSRENGRDDLIDWNDCGLHLGVPQFQREIGGGESSGDGDLCLLELFIREPPYGDDHGAVALAYTATAGHELVAVLKVGVRMERDSWHIVEGLVDGLVI